MKSIILKVRSRNNRHNNRLNSNKSNNPNCKTVKPPSYNEKLFTKSNIPENVIDNNESNLLVNSKTSRKINPGRTRKLLSTPIKENPPLPLLQKRRFPEK